MKGNGPNSCVAQSPSDRPEEARLAWALGICRAGMLRITPVREKVLAYLAAHRVPANLQTIAASQELSCTCDTTTVYRTLMLFVEMEVVRQVSVRNRRRYFTLNFPGNAGSYLICRKCGALTELPALDSVENWEKEVAAAQGYTGIYHELELYGICPQCQKNPEINRPPNKLRVKP